MIIQDEYIEQLIGFAEDAIYDGDYHQARKLLESGLLEEPGYPRLHYTLAWMHHYYQEQLDLAVRHYQLAIYFDPEYVNAYEGLIELYLAKRKFMELAALMHKARKVANIDQEFVLTTLGKVAEKQGNYANAIWYYRMALMECTDNYDTRELKQHVKRTRLKRFKTIWKPWQPRN